MKSVVFVGVGKREIPIMEENVRRLTMNKNTQTTLEEIIDINYDPDVETLDKRSIVKSIMKLITERERALLERVEKEAFIAKRVMACIHTDISWKRLETPYVTMDDLKVILKALREEKE